MGTNARTEETFIGTGSGVVKCRTTQRFLDDKKWDAELINSMPGTTWKPVPGHQSDHVPVEIRPDGSSSTAAEEASTHAEHHPIPTEEDISRNPNIKRTTVTDIRVTHKDVAKHGRTPGCKACDCIADNRKIPSGLSHSAVCRKRIRESIQADEDTQERISRADKRKTRSETSAIESFIGKSRGVKNESPAHIGKLEKELGMQMLILMGTEMDVSDIYSPPRVAVKAAEMGLRAGWSLDLTTRDQDGKRWDFSKASIRKRAITKIKRAKPLVIIGSPMCTDWCTMMNFNWDRMKPEEKERRLKEARGHLRFCIRIYQHQVETGR